MDRLDELAQDPKKVLALMLWKARHQQPDLYVQLTEQDLDGFEACTSYLKVKPDVMIKRPQGLPAQEAIPSSGSRRAVQGREATPPKPYVVVALVEAGTENSFRPIENNQADYDTAQQVQEMKRAKEMAPMLAGRLMQQAQTGDSSLSDLMDAANALVALSR